MTNNTLREVKLDELQPSHNKEKTPDFSDIQCFGEEGKHLINGGFCIMLHSDQVEVIDEDGRVILNFPLKGGTTVGINAKDHDDTRLYILHAKNVLFLADYFQTTLSEGEGKLDDVETEIDNVCEAVESIM